MTTRKKIISKIGVITSVFTATAVVLAVALLGFLGMGSGAHNPNDTSWASSLTGTWHQTPNDMTPVNMVADISNNHISITMSLGGDSGENPVTGLYWDGTFDADHNTSSPFSVVSVANKAALENKLLASLHDTKTFTYDDGQLIYDFTMMGVTTTVHLSRGE